VEDLFRLMILPLVTTELSVEMSAVSWSDLSLVERF
jgi:hypothetical protein